MQDVDPCADDVSGGAVLAADVGEAGAGSGGGRWRCSCHSLLFLHRKLEEQFTSAAMLAIVYSWFYIHS